MTQLSTRLGLCAVALSFLLAGCEGTAEADGGTGGFDAGPFDAGPQPIKYEQYLRRTDGWPTGARVRGAAVLDNVLYVASDQGLLSLNATETRWATVATPLTGDVKPTSIDRFDQSLVMTAAGATGGGLYVKSLDGDWAQVTTAPSTPSWTLVKKSTDYLLATTGGLFASASLSGPYVRRSVVNTAVFAAPLTQLVAAPSQQKLFAWSNGGSLFESIDNGRNWTASSQRGPVAALAAMGAIVVVSTGMDGQQRSDNYGNTFRPATSPLAGGVLFYVTDGARFWAGGNGGLSSSADDGLTFAADSDGLPAGVAVRALFFAGSYAVVDTTEGPFINQP